ncbi:MAG: cobalamin-binding protein [Ignavibacteria bacterium]|nr:cobalamin-binding protein [Ignavibacteria bacterium]
MKICSLLPSSTEIIYALGLGDNLVAVTHECDYPPEALSKPRVTRSDISPSLSSAEIDFRVRQQLTDVGSLYSLDADMLELLKPDVIFTQQLCTVCAVSYENVARIAYHLNSKPKVINLEPTSLEGIFDNIMTVGKYAGVVDQAEAVIHFLRQRVNRIESLVRHRERENVLCLEWLDPPFCAGHWIPELVEIAGGFDALGRKHQPSTQVAWEQILSYNPDVLVITCCGFSVERTMQELSLLRKPMLEGLKAFQDGNVFVVDGSSYFSRPGPRIVDSVEILATIIHPELFPIDYPSTVVEQVQILEAVHSQ